MSLSPLARLAVARGFLAVARDPSNLDEVLGIADRLGSSNLPEEDLPPHLVAVELPDSGDLPPLDQLRTLPEGTVGRAYAQFMDAHGLTPDALSYPEGASDVDRFRRHVRTSHDLWHVATGWNPDGVGELGLQAFYLAQLRFSFPALILAAGFAHVLWKQRDIAWDVVDAASEGWRQGSNAELLVGVDWVEWMARPLTELQAELGITPASPRELLLPLAA